MNTLEYVIKAGFGSDEVWDAEDERLHPRARDGKFRKKEDLEAGKIADQAFNRGGKPYTKPQFEKEFGKKKKVIKKDGKVVGFISYEVKNGKCKIRGLAVDDKHRNSGYAKKLLKSLMAKHNHVELEVNDEFKEAKNLYKSLGFKEVSRDRDSVTMEWKSISKKVKEPAVKKKKKKSGQRKLKEIRMPYDVNNPPEKLRGLPENKQRQWVHVYDSCMKDGGDDIKCQKMAWGVTGGWKEKSLDAALLEIAVSETLGMNVELED